MNTPSIKSKFVKAGGVSTFYLEAGEGPHLVLMHGGGIGIDAMLTWHLNIEALAKRFHVVAFDEVGFGRSSMPHTPGEFTKLSRAEHALAVLDVLDIDQAILVGHSEGGFMGTKIAVDHPQRVAKLVIVASGATAPRWGDERDQAWIDAANEAYDWALESSSEDAFVENFKRSMLFYPELADEQRLRENFRLSRKSGNMNLYLNLPPEVADLNIYYSMSEQHIHPHLSSLNVETLLVWANNDPTVPVERGLRLRQMIPGADMHILDHAKHMLMIDQSTAFNRLLLGVC